MSPDQRFTNNNQNMNLDPLVGMLEEKGFEIEQNKDLGAGLIDLVCKINVHPSLPAINCGFIVLKSDEGGSKDYEDNQFSLRKIQEAIVRGIRSGLDKVYLVAPNDEMAKSVSGKIEWLASFGSLLRLDAISLGIFPEQQESAVITPSRKRVPEGEKLRKQTIKKREAKIERHSKPKGERSRRESKVKKRVREALLDRHSRPKGQRKRKERR
ncbi:MAG: hypothetical protein M3146_05740 [Thermoproteota archaeon]|nr:hypothetical protein [Thermoproteota archaeon]